MKAHHLSASKMSLAYICAWGFRGDAEQFDRPPGREARVGSIVHLLSEWHIYGTQATPLGAPDELALAYEMFSSPVRARLDATKWTDWEIGLQYDAASDTAARGPRRGEPGYGEVGAMVLPMTLDGAVHEGDLVTVADLKSGKIVADDSQLRAQAVAATRYYGAKRARVGYLYARKTKCDEPRWVDLSEDDLDAEAGRIGRLLRTLPVAQPNPGDHCWKCNARPACPAYGATQAANDLAEREAAGFFG